MASFDQNPIQPSLHQRVYKAIKAKILFGQLPPGKSITIRGLAEELNVSAMPVREAVRRLMAERALQMHDNRRVSIPAMSAGLVEEIAKARLALEPDLAELAFDNLRSSDIDALTELDKATDVSMKFGDVETYIKQNYQFHFSIYEKANSKVVFYLVESLWMQFGPFMRVVCGRFGTAGLDDQHRQALSALRRGDKAAFRGAIEEDIRQGMSIINSVWENEGGIAQQSNR